MFMFKPKLFPSRSYKTTNEPFNSVFQWNGESKTADVQSEKNLAAIARQLGHYYNSRDFIRVYNSSEKATELITSQTYVYVSYHGVR